MPKVMGMSMNDPRGFAGARHHVLRHVGREAGKTRRSAVKAAVVRTRRGRRSLPPPSLGRTTARCILLRRRKGEVATEKRNPAHPPAKFREKSGQWIPIA